MEHRWGRRIAIRVPIRLINGSGESLHGELADASISGGFVRIDRGVPLRTRLEVEIAQPGEPGREPERVTAHVIRRTGDGVGIEWSELAPRAVRELLRACDPPRRLQTAGSRGVREGFEWQAGRLAALAARAGLTASTD